MNALVFHKKCKTKAILELWTTLVRHHVIACLTLALKYVLKWVEHRRKQKHCFQLKICMNKIYGWLGMAYSPIGDQVESQSNPEPCPIYPSSLSGPIYLLPSKNLWLPVQTVRCWQSLKSVAK